MPTRYTPDRKTIGNILSLTNPPVVVPDWQRNFSWTTSEIDTFWQDLERFNKLYPDKNIDEQEYFLGAIVIVDTKQGHLLLDGQQRIATAAILLSVIRDFLAKYNMDAAVRVSTRYLTDYDDSKEDYTYKVTLNRYDRDFFKREILEFRTTSYSPPLPTQESHKLIRKAREYFYEKFQSQYSLYSNPQDAHKWALRILSVLTNHVSLVAVITDDEDNASNVFETLNDRGIGLSTPDLLRNLVLRRAKSGLIDEILDLWGEIFKIEGDTKLQDFFRHFWISREGDVKSRSLYREIKSKIVEFDIDSLSFSRSLCDSSKVYLDIINSTYGDSNSISKLLNDINSLGAKVLYPSILSLLEATDDAKTIEKYLQAFIVTYLRHTVIGKKENSLIENIMFSIAKRIRKSNFETVLQDLKEFAPSDEHFIEDFRGVSISRIASARYILKEIEQHLRTTEELDVAPPDRVHVEHIYPQTPKQDERVEQHSTIINRLGNLTLLSKRLNTKIRNSTFSVKKEYYIESELLITKSIAEKYGVWNIDTINQRQNSLADYCIEIWSF